MTLIFWTFIFLYFYLPRHCRVERTCAIGLINHVCATSSSYPSWFTFWAISIPAHQEGGVKKYRMILLKSMTVRGAIHMWRVLGALRTPNGSLVVGRWIPRVFLFRSILNTSRFFSKIRACELSSLRGRFTRARAYHGLPWSGTYISQTSQQSASRKKQLGEHDHQSMIHRIR